MERPLPISITEHSTRRDPAGSSLRMLGILFVTVLVLIGVALPSSTWDSIKEEAPVRTNSNFKWEEVENGYAIGRYELGQGNKVLKPEVLLLSFDPEHFSFNVIAAAEINEKTADLRTLTLETDGLAGINAHFFDENRNPLGLLISGGQTKNRMHRGGRLLTGVFYISGSKAVIAARDDFKEEQAENAIQAGPRLIVNGKPLKVSELHEASRRSGIAITRAGRVILYATYLRFPGATLEQIQEMLLDPALDVVTALNLDGGGSSQLFIRKNHLLVDDTFITGGDQVPVGLVVKRKAR
jgi:uncharacterized protein YigE (DUF2233 family)